MTKNDLEGFTGTSNYYPHWTGKVVFTDGVKYLADKAEAYWLIDAIASYQNDEKITGDNMLRDMQFWKLIVNGSKGLLTCVQDKGYKPAITQNIEFTDFPLDEVEIWVERGGFPTNNGGWVDAMVLMLPGER